MVYVKLSLYKEASQLFHEGVGKKHYINTCYDLGEALYILGVVYYELGRYEDSIFLFENAIKIKPNYEKAYYNLGNAYRKVYGYEDDYAENAYNQAIMRKPDYAEAYNALGNIYRERKRYKYAIEYYKKAIKIKPYDVKAYYHLALAYIKHRPFTILFLILIIVILVWLI
jgi:tetratricopeptide (TPR) repeat protein